MLQNDISNTGIYQGTIVYLAYFLCIFEFFNQVFLTSVFFSFLGKAGLFYEYRPLFQVKCMYFNGLVTKKQEIPLVEIFLYHNHSYSAVKIRALKLL